jgi:large subunit ribosomal protein L23
MAKLELTNNDVIIKPLTTEKTVRDAEYNKYYFEVHPKANKYKIKKAVEELFSVKVKNVNVSNVAGKPKRRGVYTGRSRSWKKAVVTLVEGYRIKELEGQH